MPSSSRAGTGTGMTILEMTVASTIFLIFAVQFSNLWATTNKQTMFMLDRATTVREATMARMQLTVDLSSATAVSITNEGYGFSITANGGRTINYRKSGYALERWDSVSNSTMAVAVHLSSATHTLGVMGDMTADYEFSVIHSNKAPETSNVARAYPTRLQVLWNKVTP